MALPLKLPHGQRVVQGTQAVPLASRRDVACPRRRVRERPQEELRDPLLLVPYRLAVDLAHVAEGQEHVRAPWVRDQKEVRQQPVPAASGGTLFVSFFGDDVVEGADDPSSVGSNPAQQFVRAGRLRRRREGMHSADNNGDGCREAPHKTSTVPGGAPVHQRSAAGT